MVLAGGSAGAQPARHSRIAARGAPGPHKSVRDKPKLNSKGESDTTKPVTQAVDL